MKWQAYAQMLADKTTDPGSRWHKPVGSLPRHLFVPRWWERTDDHEWAWRSGPADIEYWSTRAYTDQSLVTSIGRHHADQSDPHDRPTGQPTTAATLPSVLVRMFQLALIHDGDKLLHIGTGSGYGTALACKRLGSDKVTTVDADPYLTEAAFRRLGALELWPTIQTADATGPLRGAYDRIVATVGVRTIPASWLEVLRPGGRLVTTIEGTSLIITATKQADGTAIGRVEWERAAFTALRHADDTTRAPHELLANADQDAAHVTMGRYPVVDIDKAWDLASMVAITVPGVTYDYREVGQARFARMAHPDGSWARAVAAGMNAPVVNAGGPRHLWHTLDELRGYWLENGELPIRGAHVRITPDGTTELARGTWRMQL